MTLLPTGFSGTSNECEYRPDTCAKDRRQSRKSDLVSTADDRHSQRDRGRSEDPEVSRGLHDEDRPRCRYVGNGLGSAEETTRLPTRGQRLCRTPERRRNVEG